MSLQSVLAGLSKEISRLKSLVADLDRRLVVAPLNAGKAKRLTIASGVIEATRPYIHLIPESGTTDTLNTISNGSEGKIIILAAADAGDTITVNTHSVDSGNIDLAGDETSIDLADEHDSLMLIYRESTAHWEQIGGSGSGGGGGAVDSVNGQTGTVVLDPDDLDDSATTNKFTTAADITKLAGIEANADVTDAANIAAAIIAQDGKTTPADTDIFPGLDSADSYQIKEFSWANIKAALTTLFNAAYVALTGNQSIAGIKTFTDDAAMTGGLTVGHGGPSHVQDRLRIGPSNGAGTGAVLEYDNGTDNMFWFLEAAGAGSKGQIRTDSARAIILQDNSTSSGGIGVGTTAPEGKLHVHDGIGGMLFVSKSGIAGTPVVIIPNGTGDVIANITGQFSLQNSDGTKTGGMFSIPVGGSYAASIGGTTWTFSVAANGQFSVVRTAGADTAIITMLLVWR